MKNFSLSILLGLFVLTLASCEGNKVINHTGKMRMVNASFYAGNINLIVDYEKVYATDVQYLNFGMFREFIEGKHKVQVKNAGGDLLIDTSLFMYEYRHYSLFVYDSLSNVKYKVIDENFVTPVGSNCKVRFLHFGNNVPMIDITKIDDTGFHFKNFINGMNSEFFSMGSGMNQFVARYSSNQNLLYTQAPYNYKPGYFYTLFLRGDIGSTGLDSVSFSVIENNKDYE